MINPGAIVFSIFTLFCMGSLLVVGLLDLHHVLFGIFGVAGFFCGLATIILWGDS